MSSNFNFSDNIILEDDVVLLRPLQKTDVENLLEFSINEPETWKFSLAGADGKENLIQYIQSAMQQRENHKEFFKLLANIWLKRAFGLVKMFFLLQSFLARKMQ